MDKKTNEFIQSLRRLSDMEALIQKSQVSKLLNIDEPMNQCYKFPGSQPVSLDKVGLSQIVLNEYMVCEKTDGTRYLLYVDCSELTVSPSILSQIRSDKPAYVLYYAYLVDREYNFF